VAQDESAQATGRGQAKHKHAPADWQDLLPQGLAWQWLRTVAAANSGWWGRSASDGSRKGNVEQMQKKMEMVADGGHGFILCGTESTKIISSW
jgi:hypothetical protein